MNDEPWPPTGNEPDELVLRPSSLSSAVTVVYCVVVLAPLAAMVVAGVFFFTISFGPRLGAVVAAAVCAFLGPAMLMIVPLGLQAVRNVKLVVTGAELNLVGESGRLSRTIPIVAVTGVWSALLPPGASGSDVPRRPKRVFIVTGASGYRPIVLHGEWSPRSLHELWQRLGRGPVDVGRMSVTELERRCPGTKESLVELFGDNGKFWWRVYGVVVGLLLAYIAVVTLVQLV
ncbi:hypothetical protein QM806_38400 [Rhodococcus sp. IEGM 1351]|uniref:hypothetical protein n=1 Tax=Rhodococcus sp. IEGM 1351 TaxID=3047089 RepID=UPI0024B78EDE|nr:hypothetical protein [Rhodococcus sp. IEGM 1351]MDI9941223.1 hypothetical protein [Rhodococcus sp. IEGM 1351]